MIPDLGKIIRTKRQQLDMTIEQLAEASNSSVSFISKLELGRLDNLKLKKLEEILNALNLSFADIFSYPPITDSETIQLISLLSNLPEEKRRILSKAILQIVLLND
ncbi:helix-turn-helix transcriptional regulator [Ligilactobacillus sp. Marseille-Q7487]|uniref:helix-turn-helix domain-containing protein n=1 Tax=Ligilactobacillus sp. Marseille-Q7487 TaxID=3022128 RepID=UPI0024A9949E|nr:helix-turn-helix transcriptional regulator [Ligilactobacillus sp. Marseille-Q7487]